MGDADRRRRADDRRRRAVLHKARLQPVEADLDPIRGEDAISLVLRLTTESWSLSGLEQPTYTRERIPWRFVRGHLT